MKRPTFLVAIGSSLLVSFALAPRSRAVDLTGTWVGKWKCQGFDGARFTSGNSSSTLLVTQTGNTIAANIDGGEFLYNGGAIPETANPDTKGEIALVQCGSDNLVFAGEETEILRGRVKASAANCSGTIKGLSVLESAFPDVITCKYSFKRTDTVDPAVPACP